MRSLIGPSSFAGSSAMKWPFGVVPGWNKRAGPLYPQTHRSLMWATSGGDVTLKDTFPLAEGYPEGRADL